MIAKNKKRITLSLLEENVKYLESKSTDFITKSNIADDIISEHIMDKLYKNWLITYIAFSVERKYEDYRVLLLDVEIFDNYICCQATIKKKGVYDISHIYFNFYLSGIIEIKRELEQNEE